MKKSMPKMQLRSRDHIDQGRLSVQYDILEGNFSNEDMSTKIYGQENAEVNWNLRPNVPPTNRNDGYVPMMVSDDEIAGGPVMDYNTMECEDATEIDNLTLETLMKMEMEMMKIILGKP
ncbi:hypothetical protein RIF29_29354 [Crotalaria pallida]|uniref:Uncharacterized protein n=1 Tax=Crotalaria pallida TaxID=3830 RepID=A0AAN9I0B3_CROPI